MRITGNDHQLEKLWLLYKFSLSVPKAMYRDKFREYGYWCQGKHKHTVQQVIDLLGKLSTPWAITWTPDNWNVLLSIFLEGLSD